MTEDLRALLEVVKQLGTTGAVLWIVWRFTDKWAGKFLEVQTTQATAMRDLAAAVKESQGEQREVLLAVRVLAAKLDETKGWIKELDEHVRGRG